MEEAKLNGLVIKVSLLSEFAKVPEKATAGAAAFDLFSSDIVSSIDNFIEYGTGIAVEIPAGYVGLIFPRSSITKTNLILANSVGVIDSDYRGEVKVRFKKVGNSKLHRFSVGERIAQLMIIELPKSPEFVVTPYEDLLQTVRGSGGFGSTGKLKIK